MLRFGPRANEWCDALPARVRRLAGRWGFDDVGRPASRGSTSYVLSCRRRNGGPAVLKLSPDCALVTAEAEALAAYRTSGRVPRVFDSDGEDGALLLEAIEPGTPLGDGRAAAELGRIAGLVRDLHRAPDEQGLGDFPPLIDRVEFIFEFWGRRLQDPGIASLVPRDLLERSLQAARDLATRPERRVLVHGDLHPGNVLDGGRQRGLVAVDPRACVGDPAFDLIDWVLVGSATEHESARRCAWLAGEVGVAPARLWRWCASTAVLVAIGRLARGSGPNGFVRMLLTLADDS